jgi:peptidoglycan/xylan/chitin deacetylase (PgdA/CDA1 family)
MSIGKNKNIAAILMYHHIGDPPPKVKLWALYVSRLNFAFQMWYLKKAGYNIISLEALGAAAAAGLKIPPYSVVLTFDDGFRDFYTNAYPILKKYNFEATVFAVTGQCGRKGDWEGIELTGTGDIMTEAEMIEIARNSKITFAPHTDGHKKLSALPMPEADAEIKASIDAIKKISGRDVKTFAAPYGDYNAETLGILRKYNIEFAVTTLNRAFNAAADNLLEMPRIIVRRNNHPPGFIYKLYRTFSS